MNKLEKKESYLAKRTYKLAWSFSYDKEKRWQGSSLRLFSAKFSTSKHQGTLMSMIGL